MKSARANLEDLLADLGAAPAGEDKQELLVPLVRVVDEALLARRHAREGQDDTGQPRHHGKGLHLDIGVWVPGVPDTDARRSFDLGCCPERFRIRWAHCRHLPLA